MGVGIFISSLTWWRLQVSLKFHGGGNLDIIFNLWTRQVSLKFHGGGNDDIVLTLWRIQVSLKFHGGGNFDIFFNLVGTSSHFEVPWGWEF